MTAVRIFEHAPETVVVFENIDVLERYLTAGEVLTGSRGVRSKIFAENQDRFGGHGSHLLWLRLPAHTLIVHWLCTMNSRERVKLQGSRSPC